jgi:prevent-host-death family protein
MEAGIRELRNHLSRYIELVRNGQEVTVTDHGTGVAKLVPMEAPRALDRLIAEGLVTPAPARKRLRSSRSAIAAKGTVSDLVSDQRR